MRKLTESFPRADLALSGVQSRTGVPGRGYVGGWILGTATTPGRGSSIGGELRLGDARTGQSSGCRQRSPVNRA